MPMELMRWQWTPYTILLIATATVAAVYAYYVRRRRVPWIDTSIALLAAGAIWTSAYALELASLGLETKVLWSKVQYVGIVIIPVAWAAFVLRYTGHHSWSRVVLPLLAALSLISLALVWTNDWHGLMWSEMASLPESYLGRTYPDLTKTNAIGYWCFVVYFGTVVLASFYFLAQMMLHSSPLYPRQHSFLLVGMLAPVVVGTVGIWRDTYPDHLPLIFTVSTLTVLWSMVYLRKGDLLTVSRHAALEGIDDAVFVIDMEERVIDTNAACQEILGACASRVSGQRVADLWPELREQLPPLDDMAPLHQEVTLDDGSQRGTYDVHISPLTDWQDRPIGRVAVMRDVTPLREMSGALEEEKREKERILDSLSEHVTYINRFYRVVWANDAACRATGKTRAEIAGRTCREIWPDCRQECSQCPVTLAMETGIPHEKEVTDDKGHHWIVSGYPAKDAKEQAFGAIKIARDITDRHQIEQEKEILQSQLLQARKMEAIGTLAGGIAHDFNNLLTAIQGNATLAKILLGDDSPAAIELSEIELACQRATRLTRQLLMFGRRQSANPVPLYLNQVIDELAYMLGRLIGEDIEIVTEFDPDLWTIYADKGNIEQIVINLAINARDAMPRGGTITLRTENVRITEEQTLSNPDAQPGAFIRFSVSDTGIGMDEEVIDHLFEPFFSTKEEGAGTGLGLVISYSVVQQHGGWIEVESEVGVGSTFTIYLPAATAVKEPLGNDDDTQQRELQGKGERILLVEDEESVREFATRVLGQNGYTVFGAADAEKAIEILERERWRFDLLFSDVVLPDRSGLELAEQVIGQKPQFRILLSSGYTGRRSQWDQIRDKGFRFLQKPYTLSELLGAIRDSIE